MDESKLEQLTGRNLLPLRHPDNTDTNIKRLNGADTKTPNGEITNGKTTYGEIINGEYEVFFKCLTCRH